MKLNLFVFVIIFLFSVASYAAQESDSPDCPADNNACVITKKIDYPSHSVCMATPLDCNDNNLCTDDACDPSIGCVYSSNKVMCDDGDICTTKDQCKNGECVAIQKNCNDYNSCTADMCDGVQGCLNKPLDGLPCSLGEACMTGGRCNYLGKCEGEIPVDYCKSGDGCCPQSCVWKDDADCEKPEPVIIEAPKEDPKLETKEDAREGKINFVCPENQCCSIENNIYNIQPVLSPAQKPVFTPECIIDCENCDGTIADFNREVRQLTNKDSDIFAQCEVSDVKVVCTFRSDEQEISDDWKIVQSAGRPFTNDLFRDAGEANIAEDTVLLETARSQNENGEEFLVASSPLADANLVEDMTVGSVLLNGRLSHAIQKEENGISHILKMKLPCQASWTGTDGAPSDTTGREDMVYDFDQVLTKIETGQAKAIEDSGFKNLWRTEDIYKFAVVHGEGENMKEASFVVLSYPGGFDSIGGCNLLKNQYKNKRHGFFLSLAGIFFGIICRLVISCWLVILKK